MTLRCFWARGMTAASFLAVLAGCGGGGSEPAPKTQGGAGGDGSALNEGAKAVETVEVNPGLADWGAKVFEQRACVTCHAIGSKKQGPDLHGVAARRTEAWMTKQIIDPEWMVKNDPLARQLFAQYALQMANQQVPEQEVKALIHFFAREARESGASTPASQ